MKKTERLSITVIFYRTGKIGLSVEQYTLTCSFEQAAKFAISQLKLELKEKSKELLGIESIQVQKAV